MPLTNFPNGVTSFGIPVLPFGVPALNKNGKVLFVDGTNGVDGNKGTDPSLPLQTIQRAADLADIGTVIFVFPKEMAATDTDPGSYAETVIVNKAQVSVIGVSHGRTQGGLPQVKKGSGTTALLEFKAPGCMVANMGFNGNGATCDLVKFSDDGGSTKAAFGGSVVGCHFKNHVSATAGDSSASAAINLAGPPWQMRIVGNTFYKNVGGISTTVQLAGIQDLVIEDNLFLGTAGTVDTYIYIGGSGNDGVMIRRNYFGSVLPAVSGGVNKRYVIALGTTGLFADNYVAGVYTTAGFGAAKAAANLPTTIGIAHNYSDSGLIVREP